MLKAHQKRVPAETGGELNVFGTPACTQAAT